MSHGLPEPPPMVQGRLVMSGKCRQSPCSGMLSDPVHRGLNNAGQRHLPPCVPTFHRAGMIGQPVLLEPSVTIRPGPSVLIAPIDAYG